MKLKMSAFSVHFFLIFFNFIGSEKKHSIIAMYNVDWLPILDD